MNAHVNVNEQRKQLNKLDQEIERALNGTSFPSLLIPVDLEALNNNTKYHNRMLKIKLSTNRSASPVDSLSPNNRVSHDRPLAFQRELAGNKSPKQGLQLSPEYLVPRGDPLKELGFMGSEDKENHDYSNMVQPRSTREFIVNEYGKKFNPREQIAK
jgi:hypothetical protein